MIVADARGKRTN